MTVLRPGLQRILLVAALFALCGCAFDLAHVDFKPAVLTLEEGGGRSFTLSEEVKVVPACGYSSVLKKDSEWVLVGSLPEGGVYKPVNQVFTVECSHMFEAYIVVSDKTLVGYYLPVQSGFFPSDPKALPIP